MINCSINKLRFNVFVNMIPVMVLMLIYTTPILHASISNIIPLCLIFIWLLHTIIITGDFTNFVNQRTKWWILYYIWGFVMILLGLSNVAVTFQLSVLAKYIIPIIGFFVIKYYNKTELSWLVAVFFLCFLGNVVWSIIIDIQQPDLFESLSSSKESRELATMMNLTTTSHNALCLFSIGTFWMCVENTCGFFKKMFLILLAGILGYFMLMVDTRGTTTLLLGILILGIFLARKEPSSTITKRKRYYKFWIIMLSIILVCVITPLLKLIVDHIDSQRLAERLNDVLVLTVGGNLNNLPEGSLAQRIALSQVSLRTFFATPINMLIGIGEQSYTLGDDLTKLGIGQHSEFIDVLARNGIFGAFIYFKILKTYISTLHLLSGTRNIIKFVDVFFFVYILYGFLNNVFQPLMLMFVFIIYPAVVILLNFQNTLISGKKSR